MSSEFVFDMTAFDFAQLAEQLERCGAKAYGTLDDEETVRRMVSGEYIRIPVGFADQVAAALFSIPQKRRRPKLWSSDIEGRAFRGLIEGEPLNALAREIAAATGQSVLSARRRLQEMKAGLQGLRVTRIE